MKRLTAIFLVCSFSSGVSHGTTSVLNLPAKKAIINSENKDYTIRIQ